MPGLLDLFTGGGEQTAPAPGMTPEEQAQQDAFSRRARMDQLGQIGAVLFAAGQKQMPSERAASLQNLGPALASYNEQMKQQQKAQLEALQVAKARQELVRDRQFREMLPKYVETLQKSYPGITPEMIASLPQANIIEMVKAAMKSPEEKKKLELELKLKERELSEPKLQTVEQEVNGEKKTFIYDPRNPNATFMSVDQLLSGKGTPTQPPNNPFASGGKMNEAQSKDALYASRMIDAEEVLQDPAIVSAATNLSERGKARVPVAGNYLVSPSFQQFDQAQRNFINATLRRESGAVISPDEFKNAEQQYFPQPGDTPEKLEQKRQNRLQAIRGIGAGAGPSWKPGKVLGASGDILYRPTTKQEYDAVPKGRNYIDPEGNVRTKP